MSGMSAEVLMEICWNEDSFRLCMSIVYDLGNKVTACRDIRNKGLKMTYRDDLIKMETCSALLAICAGNSPVTGEFPTQRPVTRSFDVFDVFLIRACLNGW